MQISHNAVDAVHVPCSMRIVTCHATLWHACIMPCHAIPYYATAYCARTGHSWRLCLNCNWYDMTCRAWHAIARTVFSTSALLLWYRIFSHETVSYRMTTCDIVVKDVMHYSERWRRLISIISGCTLLFHGSISMPWDAVLCCCVLCCAMLCYAMLCYAMHCAVLRCAMCRAVQCAALCCRYRSTMSVLQHAC